MADNGLIITVADVGDAEVLTSLSVTTFLETFLLDNKKEDMDKYIAEEMNIARLTDELKDPENVFFLAKYRDAFVAYAKMRAVKVPTELKDQNPVELERIYVLRQYHAQKVGAALMHHCLDHARSKHYNTMWLGVWEHNYKAVNFYKKWGFEFFGSHIFRLGDDDQTDMLMKKPL